MRHNFQHLLADAFDVTHRLGCLFGGFFGAPIYVLGGSDHIKSGLKKQVCLARHLLVGLRKGGEYLNHLAGVVSLEPLHFLNRQLFLCTDVGKHIYCFEVIDFERLEADFVCNNKEFNVWVV